MRLERIGLVFLAAAASVTPLAAQTARVIVVPALRGIPPRTLHDTMGVVDTVPFKAAAVFAALQTVYDSIKVKMEILDVTALQLGNQAFFNRGKFAGRRMSAYLDCGNGFTGPHADNYRIYISLISFIDPLAKDSSLVRNLFIGSAVNVTEGNRPIQDCRTTGELEARMRDIMRGKLTEIR
jgi:hypothetical protein